MHAASSCSWKPSTEPAVYDCRAAKLRLPLWSQVCSKAAAKYQGYQPSLQSLGPRSCNGTHAHAHRMLRQLDGRTVAVLGDSHALNLWCALTCWFSSAPGVLVERRDQPASLTSMPRRPRTPDEHRPQAGLALLLTRAGLALDSRPPRKLLLRHDTHRGGRGAQPRRVDAARMLQVDRQPALGLGLGLGLAKPKP